MIRSIRGRLQLWYGAVYAVSIVVFGCLVYWRADRDVNERATLQVVSTAQYLDLSLRSVRPGAIREAGAGREPGGMRPPGNPSNDPFPPEYALGPLPPEFQFRPPRYREPSRRSPADLNEPPQALPPHEQMANANRDPNPGRPMRSPGSGGPNGLGPYRGPAGPPGSGLDSVRPPGPASDDGDGPDRPPVDRMEFVVWRPDGGVLTRSDGASVDNYANQPAPVVHGAAPQITRTRGLIEAFMRGPHGATILVVRPMENDMARLHQFGFQIAAMAVVTLLVGIVGGWAISGRMVQPIHMISETAAQISARHLDRRIETRHLDKELIQLASVLNGTFGRLEQSFGRLTQFTADASHELRTPLAVIQSQVELALSQERSSEWYQQTLATCLRSSERMRSLVDGLLLLARTDSDHLEIRSAPLDLRNVAEDAVAQLHDKAVSAGIDLECTTPETAIMVSGDSRFLSQVPVNLIDNAIQHTPPGGKILIDVRIEGRDAVLSVSDTGCGIATEHIPFLFERFYRVDAGRSRKHGGSGLGLAICRGLVEAHGGTISCASTVGQGSMFVVRLPLRSGAMVRDPSAETSTGTERSAGKDHEGLSGSSNGLWNSPALGLENKDVS